MDLCCIQESDFLVVLESAMVFECIRLYYNEYLIYKESIFASQGFLVHIVPYVYEWSGLKTFG
jgi:hypothetical protein